MVLAEKAKDPQHKGSANTVLESEKTKTNLFFEPELDIATFIANEIRSKICEIITAGELLSDVIIDSEINGYRFILIREQQTHLSPREQEIARMVAKGLPNKTIAAVLEISTWTVGTHLRRIFAKLGVGTRAAMVAKYLNLHEVE